jgi:hypothetical protein
VGAAFFRFFLADARPFVGGLKDDTTVIVVDVNPSRAVPPPPAACECALS